MDFQIPVAPGELSKGNLRAFLIIHLGVIVLNLRGWLEGEPAPAEEVIHLPRGKDLIRPHRGQVEQVIRITVHTLRLACVNGRLAGLDVVGNLLPKGVPCPTIRFKAVIPGKDSLCLRAFGALLGGLPSIGLPSMGLVVATVVLTVIAAMADETAFQIRRVLVLSTILAGGSYGIFIVLLGLTMPVWPAFLVA